MRVISRKRLKEFWETHPNAETSLLLWYQRSCDAEWQSLVDIRKVFPSAD
jgi:mRNA interferase HigB